MLRNHPHLLPMKLLSPKNQQLFHFLFALKATLLYIGNVISKPSKGSKENMLFILLSDKFSTLLSTDDNLVQYMKIQISHNIQQGLSKDSNI